MKVAEGVVKAVKEDELSYGNWNISGVISWVLGWQMGYGLKYLENHSLKGWDIKEMKLASIDRGMS